MALFQGVTIPGRKLTMKIVTSRFTNTSYSDYEIVEPEEQGKAKKKMGFRYEMKRKLINYKNRREKREHDEADDAEHPSLSGQDHHVLERTVSG
ncbi:hypothetical protein FOZ63_001134 [Perkinsus olseni]|uniref:Uncharacterized protein n=1 Tax=Perkinsus olseni TaxID=32597 RepID=A0A7J6UMQ7_PEROL|nr:hypothetical protein FOZ63_001134 [Perkinsus olseni]